MFRTRCALPKVVACTTALTTHFLHHPRCSATLPGLHASRVLLAAAFTNRDGASVTTQQNQMPEAAHRVGDKEDSINADFSAASAHERVFAQPPADIVDPLFKVPRLAQQNTATATTDGEAVEHEDDNENSSAAFASDQNEKNAGDDGDDSVNRVVSHGEEEILADRDLPADDFFNGLHEASRQQDRKSDEGFADRHGAAQRTHQDAQTPVNLHGAAYASDMTATLRAVAHARNFISPFWSSKNAFEQIGAALIVPEGEGVRLPISNLQVVVLYNLEQTSLVDTLHAATIPEVRQYVNQHGLKSSRSPFGDSKPMNICGGSLGRDRAALLAAAATFPAWQSECPYWLTSEEVMMIGAQVRPSEKDNYISVPGLQRSCHTSAPGGEFNVDDGNVGASVRMYNLKQLEDDDGRFSLAMPVLRRLPVCYSIRGSRYSPSTSWLMLEYCVRFCLPITTDSIVMLTAERVHAQGGTVLPTKRFLSSAVAAVHEASDTRKWQNAAARTSLTDWINKKAVAGAAQGVVPPPFTVVIHDEVLTLYNAVQTDIADALHERASRERENRFLSRFPPNNT